MHLFALFSFASLTASKIRCRQIALVIYLINCAHCRDIPEVVKHAVSMVVNQQINRKSSQEVKGSVMNTSNNRQYNRSSFITLIQLYTTDLQNLMCLGSSPCLLLPMNIL